MAINYILANTGHIQLLVDARIDFLTEYWGKPEPENEQRLRHELKLFFEQELPAQSYVAWLALDGDTLAGAGGMKISRRPGSFRIPDGLHAYIMNMYTAPAYRKQGIARSIIRRLEETGKAMGISFFELHATQDGEPLYISEAYNRHNEPTYRKFITQA